MANEFRKQFGNAEITVTYEPGVCAHSGVCVAGLRGVFDPTRRHFVDLDAASTEEIIAQVKKCPSGALRYALR